MSENIPEVLICHHTGGTDENSLLDTSYYTTEGIRQWHVKLGCDDIGYHWIIEKSGELCEGRNEMKKGAHTLGMNDKSIGVCFIGNFDIALPSIEQENCFISFYQDLIKRYPNLTPDKVFPHRKYSNKTCYGKLLSDDWASNLARNAIEKNV